MMFHDLYIGVHRRTTTIRRKSDIFSPKICQ